MKEHKKLNIIVKWAAIFLVLAGIFTVAKMQLEYNENKDRIAELDAEIKNRKNKIEQLKRELSMPFDEEYIIGIAREKLNLSLPEEIIFNNDLSE